MSYVVITSREREELVELFFKLRKKGRQYPHAWAEALTALRCLKAIHSNAIEDKKVDRIFLQVLLHGAGVEDKALISNHYHNASNELRGQEEMLRSLEKQAVKSTPFSLSMLLEIHRGMFQKSWPEAAGCFRQGEVRLANMAHRPPHFSKVQEFLFQSLHSINDRLFAIQEVTPANFFEVLQISADVHYLVAQVHPFEDGNGRVARAVGDYVMLVHGFLYDVIMQDYRNDYLDAMSECTPHDTSPLRHFIEYSYLETLRRIAGFFELIDHENR